MLNAVSAASALGFWSMQARSGQLFLGVSPDLLDYNLDQDIARQAVTCLECVPVPHYGT